MTVKHLEQEVADKTFNLAEGVRLKHRGFGLKHLGVGLKRSPTPLTPPFSLIQHQSLLLHCLLLILLLLWCPLVCSGLGGYTYFSFCPPRFIPLAPQRAGFGLWYRVVLLFLSRQYSRVHGGRI